MPTQGQRQDFLWRPNNNDSTTLTRYSLEAEHWVKAVKSAEFNSKPKDWGAIFGTFGAVFMFFYAFVVLITSLLQKLFNWASEDTIDNRTMAEQISEDDVNVIVNEDGIHRTDLTDEEITQMFSGGKTTMMRFR